MKENREQKRRRKRGDLKHPFFPTLTISPEEAKEWAEVLEIYSGSYIEGHIDKELFVSVAIGVGLYMMGFTPMGVTHLANDMNSLHVAKQSLGALKERLGQQNDDE